MLSDLQDSPLEAFQSKEIAKEFHRLGLCGKTARTFEEKQLLRDSYEGAHEALLHFMQTFDLH